MKKRKIRWKNILALFFLTVFIIILIICIINIIKWIIDRNNTMKQVNNIENTVEVEDLPDNKNTELIEQSIQPSKNDPYWDYIKMNMIYVDFSELKLINNSVNGWIKVNGTNINYPFVQSKDNEYYLTHSFDKSYNQAGWVFMDYRNNNKEFDKNTILYAHGRLDTTMFGSLKNIFKSEWYNNPDNHVIKLSTKYENTLWQVFSVYRIKTTSDYIQTSFNNDDEYQSFLNLISKRSMFNFNTNIYTTDKILTLSTCYNDAEKVVMHAKLIKKQTR